MTRNRKSIKYEYYFSLYLKSLEYKTDEFDYYSIRVLLKGIEPEKERTFDIIVSSISQMNNKNKLVLKKQDSPEELAVSLDGKSKRKILYSDIDSIICDLNFVKI